MRVLFAIKEYLPMPTPPGLCIMHVQKVLLERGIQSDVIMAGNKTGFWSSNEYGKIFTIKSDITFEYNINNKIKYYISQLPRLFIWPISSKKAIRDYYRIIKLLNNRYGYDAIIGTPFPIDACIACSAFTHFFYYELDSLINNPVYKHGLKRFLSFRLKRLERDFFKRAELVIHLEQNREFYERDNYKEYKDKFAFSDIPYLINSNINEKKETSDLHGKKITMIYTGLLNMDYRPPNELIRLLKQIAERVEIECFFFSRGDCEDILRQAEIETKGLIKRMGYVSQDTLSEYKEKADFLLDIGNRLSGDDHSLPSKVIEYIALGKPIIHINGTNDSAIEYLDKYGNAINIPYDFSREYVDNTVMPFIQRNRGVKINFSEVVKLFPRNTPAYTADIIAGAIISRKMLLDKTHEN